MLKNSLQLIVLQLGQLLNDVSETLPHARSALRKPATIGDILFTAYRAQITLAILLVFLVFLAPAAVELVTGTVFPPETSKKVFGLIKTQQVNPLEDIFFVAIMIILWLSSIVSALLLFWFHIPHGLALANARAERLLGEGDRQTDTVKRRSLHKRGHALVTDTDLESELENRLREEVPSSVTASPARDKEIGPKVFDEGTVIDASVPADKVDESPSPTGLAERYELGAQIGSGAMGVVFGAWDKILDRKVAVKQLSMILSGDDEFIIRFRREAMALAQLNHPNVVQVYDLIEKGNRFWMVVEYVDGGDLASYLRENGRLSVSEAANIVTLVAEGLALAHEQGIVHRDIKPANVLLTSERVPKITDFGIAKLTQSSRLTQVGSVLGSPPYMSPEQCSGSSVDTATDVYALGITLYELLTGKVPFEGDTSSVLARQIVEQPLPLSEVLESIPPEVESLILRMLAKNPDERPSDMVEVIDSLSIFRDQSLSNKRSQFGHSRMH